MVADLEYDGRGAGEVIYLVHAGVYSSWFAPLFDEPALDGFRVIRPIRPGYGRSAVPAEPAMTDRVDAPMNRTQTTRSEPVVDSSDGHPEPDQLRTPNHAVLPRAMARSWRLTR